MTSNISSISNCSHLIELIVNFKSEQNKAFELIAGMLPELGNEVEGLRNFLKALAKKSEFERSLTNLLSGINIVSEEIHSLDKKRESLMSGINTIVEASVELSNLMDRIDRLAFRMRNTALNASISAAHGGKGSRGFSVLTQELVRLTEITMNQVLEVRNHSHQLKIVANKIIEFTNQEKIRQHEQIDEQRQKNNAINSCVSSVLQEITQTLTDMGLNLDNAMSNIDTIMLSIQREDILSQDIDHVRVVFEEVDAKLQNVTPESTASEKDDIFSFSIQASEMGNKLLSEVTQRLIELITGTKDHLDELKIASDKIETFEIRTSPSENQSTSVNLLDMDEIVNIEQIQDSFGNDDNLVNQYMNFSEELYVISEDLIGDVEEFREFIRNLSIVHIMIRIQLAESKSESNENALSTNIQGLCDEFAEFIGQMDNSITSLVKSGQDFLNQIQTTSTSRKEKTNQALKQVNTSLKTTHKSHKKFIDALSQIPNLGESMNISINNFSSQLSEIERKISKDLYSQFNSINQDLCNLAGQFSTPTGSNKVKSDLQTLSNKFTTLSHKTIAGEVGDFGVESGDCGGSLTLF